MSPDEHLNWDHLTERSGFSVEVITGSGTVFSCHYRADDLDSALEAIKNNAIRYPGRCSILFGQCDEPPKPMTMEQWIAAGQTSD